MKKPLLAGALCAVLLWSVVCPVLADDPTEPEPAATVTGTEPAGSADPEPTETEPVEADPDLTEPTDPDPIGTEPEEYEPLKTYISLQIEEGELILTVTDENGDPVPDAPLVLLIDAEVLTVTADEEGVARYTLTQTPRQIACTMPPFNGYGSASTSVVLQPSEEPAQTETAPSETETPSTSWRPTTTLGPVVTWTVNGPGEGDVTVTEIIPASTAPATEESASATLAVEVNKYSRSTARLLIIIGAVLLAVAALVVYLFLAYAPRKEAEPQEEAEEEDISEE